MNKKDLHEAVRASSVAAEIGADRIDRLVEGSSDTGPIFKPLPGARMIPVELIEADPKQPRKTMQDESLKDLASSIAEIGVLQPIVVTRIPETGHYVILAGHRRVAAAQLAKIDAIPAIVKTENWSENDRLQRQLIENIHREDIPPIEAARALQTLMEGGSLSQREAAKKLGKPLTYVAELSAILKLGDKMLARATAANLPKRALIEIARAKDPGDQKRLFEAALRSETPWQEVKKTRSEKVREVAPPRFRVAYALAEQGAMVTVHFEKPPESVSAKEVIDALSTVVQKIAGEEINHLTGGPSNA